MKRILQCQIELTEKEALEVLEDSLKAQNIYLDPLQGKYNMAMSIAHELRHMRDYFINEDNSLGICQDRCRDCWKKYRLCSNLLSDSNR